jgi:ribosome maturation factor RimP
MNLENMRKKLIPILKRYDLDIYSIRTKIEFGEKIVEILIDVDVMDIKDLEKIHLEYVDLLSDSDLDDDYYLELSSLGAERPIKSKEDVLKALGKYIYLESDKYQGNGYIISFENDIIKLEINEKGRIRKIDINYLDARNMRTSVKV